MGKYGNGGMLLDQIEIDVRSDLGRIRTVYIDVYDNSLSRKWLRALDQVLTSGHRLEKNYCFFGFADGPRDAGLLCEQINRSIDCINQADLGYQIHDSFTLDNTLNPLNPFEPMLVQEKFNRLHRYFEDLQGTSGNMKDFFLKADAITRWHIRQLNLLCHEFESWALSYHKKIYAPEWQRPSQLMCWLHAPRFDLDQEDFELFGVQTISRATGGVYVGVNKAVGKHHWEVFNDEGRDSRVGELTTSTLKSQTEAAADFDIEWAQDPAAWPWMEHKLRQFRDWLVLNGFDPEDPTLTIGHPQIGQVDLDRTFGTRDYRSIWQILHDHLDVYEVRTTAAKCTYDYRWSDENYIDFMIGNDK